MVGLIISTAQCKNEHYGITLLSTRHFEDFPSASALEYTDGKLFVIGDDAAHLMVLDTNYRVIEKIAYLPDSVYRAPKDTKPDTESAVLLTHGEQTFLYAFGSLSTPARELLFQFPLDSLQGFTRTRFQPRASSLIKEWNIEGAAMVMDQLLLANRANGTNRQNYFMLQTFDAAVNGQDNEAKVAELVLPSNGSVIGISGLFYEEELDLLLFTASEEATQNAVDDGAIGESYLGVVENFSRKMFRKKMSPDGLIKLSTVDTAFARQKVESVCVQRASGKGLILFLAADNDNGQSRIFKLSLAL